MPIWKLSPIDPQDRNWVMSSVKTEVTVRAPSERTARAAASIAFGRAINHVAGTELPIVPWRYAHLVSAERDNSGRWPEDGPVSILDPEGYDDDIAGVTFRDE